MRRNVHRTAHRSNSRPTICADLPAGMRFMWRPRPPSSAATAMILRKVIAAAPPAQENVASNPPGA